MNASTLHETLMRKLPQNCLTWNYYELLHYRAALPFYKNTAELWLSRAIHMFFFLLAGKLQLRVVKESGWEMTNGIWLTSDGEVERVKKVLSSRGEWQWLMMMDVKDTNLHHFYLISLPQNKNVLLRVVIGNYICLSTPSLHVSPVMSVVSSLCGREYIRCHLSIKLYLIHSCTTLTSFTTLH